MDLPPWIERWFLPSSEPRPRSSRLRRFALWLAAIALGLGLYWLALQLAGWPSPSVPMLLVLAARWIVTAALFSGWPLFWFLGWCLRRACFGATWGVLRSQSSWLARVAPQFRGSARIAGFGLCAALFAAPFYVLAPCYLARGHCLTATLILYHSARFDPVVWARTVTEGEGRSCDRAAMSGDLEERVLRPGTPRDEVVRLLGTPERDAPGEISYAIGMCSGWGLDPDSLRVTLDAQGRVERVRPIQH